MGNKIIIGIVDEFPLVRHGLSLALNELDEEVELIEERTLKDFLSLSSENSMDLIIVGLNQQHSDGALNIVRDIKLVYKDARIIIYDDNARVTSAKYYMGAGGDGYISKQMDEVEMIRCIKQVMNGQRYVSQDLIDAIFSISHTDALPRKAKRAIQLTAREYRIAVYLSEGKRTSWIAGELDRKNSTISTIKSTIFRKLHIGNVIELREQIGKIAIQVR